MNSKTPQWKIPENLGDLISEDASWETDEWSPIVLTVMGGTIYQGREISLSWQIEFIPYGKQFELPNGRLTALGFTPDGYGWADAISSAINQKIPGIHGELHFGDTEQSSCVIWVESERTCKTLMEIAWNMIARPQTIEVTPVV